MSDAFSHVRSHLNDCGLLEWVAKDGFWGKDTYILWEIPRTWLAVRLHGMHETCVDRGPLVVSVRRESPPPRNRKEWIRKLNKE